MPYNGVLVTLKVTQWLVTTLQIILDMKEVAESAQSGFPNWCIFIIYSLYYKLH